MRPSKEMIDKLSRALVDEGKLVEAGWISLQYTCISPNAPELQLKEMRMAFFAGAQHLFSSIMSILEPDDEPTEADLKRMDLINKELENFLTEFKKLHNIP